MDEFDSFGARQLPSEEEKLIEPTWEYDGEEE